MRGLAPYALALVLTSTLPTAGRAGEASDVVGTWRGTAEEVSSPHIQGRAQVTVDVMPDGRWTSVWRQGGRERRNAGRWRTATVAIALTPAAPAPVASRPGL